MRDRVRKQKSKSPFAQNLKLVLAERGISQKGAAELADVPPSTVGDWLSGVNPTDALAVQRLCRALKCDFEWLLTGEKGRTDFGEVPLA
jgi:transcriptional regulator with XRE-family HTH domain